MIGFLALDENNIAARCHMYARDPIAYPLARRALYGRGGIVGERGIRTP